MLLVSVVVHSIAVNVGGVVVGGGGVVVAVAAFGCCCCCCCLGFGFSCGSMLLTATNC